MPNPATSSGIRDNHKWGGGVADFLKGKIQSGRDFVIPNRQDQAKDTTDFDLGTWLVIKKP